jgi:hypothetical protein
MNTSRRSSCFGLCGFLLCISAAMLLAQGVASPDSRCFRIRVRLNGKLIDGPQDITLRSEQREAKASLEKGCFTVPSALLAEKSLDVYFVIPGNRIHLSAISTTFFSDSWDIDLEDKKFGKEVPLPKHVRTKEACAVSFHGGEPETRMSQTGCRSAGGPR